MGQSSAFSQSSSSGSAAIAYNSLGGLILSNDSGTPNTIIDVAAGQAADSTNNSYITLSSAFTKTISGTFVAGTGNAGLDTGTVAASTWYHVYVISQAGGLSPDVLLSTSATSPTMPSGYSLKRRIGAIKTDSSSHILAFTQIYDTFLFNTMSASEWNTANPGTSAVTVSLANVPTGISVTAIIIFVFDSGTGVTQSIVRFSSPLVTDQVPSNITGNYGIQTGEGRGQVSVITNTSGQIRYRVGTSVSDTQLEGSTQGWIDTRGK